MDDLEPVVSILEWMDTDEAKGRLCVWLLQNAVAKN